MVPRPPRPEIRIHLIFFWIFGECALAGEAVVEVVEVADMAQRVAASTSEATTDGPQLLGGVLWKRLQCLCKTPAFCLKIYSTRRTEFL